MKKIVTTVVMIIAGLTLMAQMSKTITITGKVTGDTKGFNNIYFYTASVPRDSVSIKNGKFIIKIPFTEPYSQAFYTQYEFRKRRSQIPFPLLIDGSGNINIEMDIEKGFFEASISGSETAVIFNTFLKQHGETNKMISDNLIKLYGKSFVPEKDTLYEKINSSRDSLTKIHMGALVSEYVQKYKNRFVGVYILSVSGRSAMEVDQLESTLQSLPSEMQKTAQGEKIAAYVRGVRNTTIGTTVKNFVLNDPEGKTVSFDQFKGKYVWIDFWASWCVPCKKAFPHMKEIYAQLKDKGFEILGVSTDSKIDPWLKILPNLQNPWPQVWDNKNIMSEFAVTAFPTSFLIDPNGKIVLMEVGYEPNEASKMDKKLEEIFGKMTFSVPDGQLKKESTGKETIPVTQMIKTQ